MWMRAWPAHYIPALSPLFYIEKVARRETSYIVTTAALWMRVFLSQTNNNAIGIAGVRYATGAARHVLCCSKCGKTRIVTERAMFCSIPVRNPLFPRFLPHWSLAKRRSPRCNLVCATNFEIYASEKVLWFAAGPFCVRGLFPLSSQVHVLAASKMQNATWFQHPYSTLSRVSNARERK